MQRNTYSVNMINQALLRVKEIFWHDDIDPLELGITLVILMFSLQLLNPFYDSFGSSPSYSSFRQLAPEAWWGIIGASISAIKAYAHVFRKHMLRICTASALTGYIMFIGLMFGFTNPQGTGVAIYGTMALLMFIVTLRAAKDAG